MKIPQFGHDVWLCVTCLRYDPTMAKKKPSPAELLVSRNVRRIRADLHGWSSSELADRLAKLTGDAWTRARVTRIETGERAWQIEDVLLFASTLEVAVDELLRPAGDDGYIKVLEADVDLHNLIGRPPASTPGPTLADLDAIDDQLEAAHDAVARARSKMLGGKP